MAARITELVNAVLEQEARAPPLSGAQVLDLIDLGGSDGGAEARRPARLPARPPDHTQTRLSRRAAGPTERCLAPPVAAHLSAAQRTPWRGWAARPCSQAASGQCLGRSPPHAGAPHPSLEHSPGGGCRHARRRCQAFCQRPCQAAGSGHQGR